MFLYLIPPPLIDAISGSYKLELEGYIYNTQIMPDGKCWMCENLRININGCYSGISPLLGKLYTFDSIKNLKIDGWHIPSKTEMQALIESVNRDPYSLQMKGFSYWRNATNTSNFSLVPTGYYISSSGVGYPNDRTYSWFTTDTSGGYLEMMPNSVYPVDSTGWGGYPYYMPLRLVKD